MDVGSCLGAEFFTGAGFDASLEFLQQGQILAADTIADYLKEWQEYGWCTEEQTKGLGSAHGRGHPQRRSVLRLFG